MGQRRGINRRNRHELIFYVMYAVAEMKALGLSSAGTMDQSLDLLWHVAQKGSNNRCVGTGGAEDGFAHGQGAAWQWVFHAKRSAVDEVGGDVRYGAIITAFQQEITTWRNNSGEADAWLPIQSDQAPSVKRDRESRRGV